VAAVQYGLTANGVRLPEFVESVRTALCSDPTAVQIFEGRLLAAGYHRLSASRYHRQFSYLITNFYEVCGELPRLTKGNVPPGVVDAIYRVEFDTSKLKGLMLADILKCLG
jgi:hypothetical protein